MDLEESNLNKLLTDLSSCSRPLFSLVLAGVIESMGIWAMKCVYLLFLLFSFPKNTPCSRSPSMLSLSLPNQNWHAYCYAHLDAWIGEQTSRRRWHVPPLSLCSSLLGR
ncbi:hypothetical protein BRADI_4g18383v3 [Brachypodium distachyon]|uniref:Uncharacterized protein n=1 Tax=Brachypodium distachyon TaxID=15368 RepID=A0A0Q3PGN4_BRADI|nr:hypothetical protein BRADI_4g18383v3 [Brachypodium distachyon]